MLTYEERSAPAALRGVVSHFAERRGDLTGRPVSLALPGRPDQFLEIYLAEPYRPRIDGGAPSPAPEMVVVGPQSYRRVELDMVGQVVAFHIHFSPTGFHRLFGPSMRQIADQAFNAADVLGHRAARLREAVRQAAGFEERVLAAAAWIADALATAAAETPVDRAARLLARAGGVARVEDLAVRSGLGVRQFNRRFAEAVGLAPKLYARTLRFNRVLDQRIRRPGESWTRLIQEAGYFDDAHFARDCRAFGGASPGALAAQAFVG